MYFEWTDRNQLKEKSKASCASCGIDPPSGPLALKGLQPRMNKSQCPVELLPQAAKEQRSEHRAISYVVVIQGHSCMGQFWSTPFKRHKAPQPHRAAYKQKGSTFSQYCHLREFRLREFTRSRFVRKIIEPSGPMRQKFSKSLPKRQFV